MAGEMHQNDLEKGGEWHDVRLALEDICESAGIKCTVKPFDQYQGPYALLPNGGKLWIDHHCTDPEYEYNYFYYEGKGGNKKGSGKEIIEHLTKICPQPKLIHKQPEKSKSPLRDPKNIKLDPLGKKEFIQKRSTPEERKHLRLIKSALRKIIAEDMLKK